MLKTYKISDFQYMYRLYSMIICRSTTRPLKARILQEGTRYVLRFAMAWLAWPAADLGPASGGRDGGTFAPASLTFGSGRGGCDRP